TGINVDETNPTISGKTTSSPNADGWYKGDVTVDWKCDDNLSGVVACPAKSTITGEGGNLSASALVSDKAGNSAGATVNSIKIDQTAPDTRVSAPSGWNNADVPVTLTPFDALSGVKATYYSVDNGPVQTGTNLTISTEGTYTITYWSEDYAGNVESAQTVQVKIDKTAPTISHTQDPLANVNGWNNSAVTVTFTCKDQENL